MLRFIEQNGAIHPGVVNRILGLEALDNIVVNIKSNTFVNSLSILMYISLMPVNIHPFQII